MTLFEVTETLYALATTPPSPAASADPNSMYPKDWWTVVVGVVAGLGGALVAGMAQAWKAKNDERIARETALWEYHRVLTDISSDISAHMGDTVEGYDDGTFRDRVKTARKAAYPYFYLFSEKDRSRLKYPTTNDQTRTMPHEDQRQIDAAADALEAFLLKGRKKNSASK